ncbi:hypothetical protein K3495_g13156, partial [Podosphaera aphanis]
MPLLQGNGITPCNTNFASMFALIGNEREVSFKWVLEQYISMLDENAIEHPYVVLSDLDRAFKNAAQATFHDNRTKHQICLWHVMKNVAHNIRKKWNGSLDGTFIGEHGGDVGSAPKLRPHEARAAQKGNITEEEAESLRVERDKRAGNVASAWLDPSDQRARGEHTRPLAQVVINKRCGYMPTDSDSDRRFKPNADGILAAWKECVYAEEKEIYHENWARLKEEFPDQPEIVIYLNDTYNPWVLQFAQFAVKLHRNFGLKVTSRVEIQHHALKNQLKNRLADLPQLHAAIDEMRRLQEERFESLLSTSKEKRITKHEKT